MSYIKEQLLYLASPFMLWVMEGVRVSAVATYFSTVSTQDVLGRIAGVNQG